MKWIPSIVFPLLCIICYHIFAAKQGDVPQTKNEVGVGSLFSKVELEETDQNKTEGGKDNLVLEEVQDDTPRDKVEEDTPKDTVQDDVPKDKE